MKRHFLELNSKSSEIPIFIGTNLWKPLSKFLGDNYRHHRVFAVADSNLAGIYESQLVHLLSSCAVPGALLTFPAGEASKNRTIAADLQDSMLEHLAGRDSLIIAVGGGVTGDLAGYVAATLHRGVPLVHLPTSLMAQVDSSIGGKVGVNHLTGKNLLGSFYQPAAIFGDLSLLETLPDEEYKNGLAEVIKYAFSLDEAFVDWIENNIDSILSRTPEAIDEIVNRCASLKISVVQKDEKEAAYRTVLNFGHTTGHAIENLSNYSVAHGLGVAAGMRVAVQLSSDLLGLSSGVGERLDRILSKCDLNSINLGDYDVEDLWDKICLDKKARRSQPRFTLIRKIGMAELMYQISKQDFINAISKI